MTKSELEATKVKLEAIIEEQKATIEAQAAEIAEKAALLDKATVKKIVAKPKAVVPEPFEFKGKVLKFNVAKFSLGKTYVAADETTNETLIEKLLEMKSPVVEVVSEEK